MIVRNQHHVYTRLLKKMPLVKHYNWNKAFIKKFHKEAKLKLCMIEQRSWCKMQMQKGISEKGQQCLKKAFNVVP
jgi:hypothetical protein